MPKYYSLKIKLNKVDKKMLYAGKDGPELDVFIIMQDKPGLYDQIGMATQSVGKEARAKGVKGNILGNLKELTFTKKDDLPF